MVLVKKMKMKCGSCGMMSKVPINKVYDGYEGDFFCDSCGQVLIQMMDILDDDISN